LYSLLSTNPQLMEQLEFGLELSHSQDMLPRRSLGDLEGDGDAVVDTRFNFLLMYINAIS